MKQCPFCKEQMQDAATTCPHCRHTVLSANPIANAIASLIVFAILFGAIWFGINMFVQSETDKAQKEIDHIMRTLPY